MRLLAFMPLTYIAGVEGFGWFVPYLIIVGLAVLIVRHRKPARSPAPVTTGDELLDAMVQPAA